MDNKRQIPILTKETELELRERENKIRKIMVLFINLI
jgi:hypothetical protein